MFNVRYEIIAIAINSNKFSLQSLTRKSKNSDLKIKNLKNLKT